MKYNKIKLTFIFLIFFFHIEVSAQHTNANDNQKESILKQEKGKFFEESIDSNKANKNHSNFEYINALLLIFGTLVGAAPGIISTYYQNKNFKKNIEFSQQETKAAREFDIKKQLFLDASEAITEVNQIIILIPFLSIDELNKKYIDSKITPSISKLHLIASIEIISALGDFQIAFTQIWFQLLFEKNVLDKYVNDLSVIEGLLLKENKDINLHNKKIELLQKKKNEMLRLSKLSIEATIKLSLPIQKVLLLTRTELNMEFDDKKYMEIISRINGKNKEFLDDLFKKIEPA
ncbi:MAG: hypothetical protein AABY64_04415 [Bdellovibrionota bacterium]